MEQLETEDSTSVHRAMLVTYSIIAINVIVFILMAMQGAGIFEANGYVHIRWGSNYGPLTLSGDWWRLITSTFLHFGIIHLLMNMYCLFTVGIYLEPMLGKTKYLVAYLCTGIFASLASLWWHSAEAANSAGASGAVFGMYGLFLAMLTTNLIPAEVRGPLLKNIGIFVIYNLIYGLKGGVDNSAHVGGLLSGVAIGYLYVFGIKKERNEQPVKWMIPAVVLVTIAAGYLYLDQHRVSQAIRETALQEVKGASYTDAERYTEKYNQFVELQDRALAPLKDTTLTDEKLAEQLKQQSLPQWEKAELLAKEMQNMDISDAMKKKAATVLEYIQLRKEEILAIEEIVNKTQTDATRLNQVREKINTVVEGLR